MEKSQAEGQNDKETRSTRSRRSSKSSGKLTVRSSAACSSRWEEWPLSPLQVTPEQKVSEYINKHSHTDLAPDITSHHDDSKYQNEQSKQPVMYTPLCPKQEQVQYSFMPQDGAERRLQRDVSPQTLHDALQLQHGLSSNNNADTIASDLARFLAKTQLITGGLSKFDDKPENYLSWKATFQSTVRDLGLTATEEINLLIKWLGPESSEHAKRLKAVNMKHPPAGLNMIWLRLEECYGSPEATENSLFARIRDFPKLSSKEPHKLRDLSDCCVNSKLQS